MSKNDVITGSGYIAVKGGVFKIDGQVVASPDSIEWEEHTLSRAYNTASGEQVKFNYRIRRKVVWKYSVIGKESFDEIYKILDDKRVNHASTRYDIDTLYMGGNRTMLVEWGTPFKSECIDNQRDLYTCEFSFIEPIGTKLQGEG